MSSRIRFAFVGGPRGIATLALGAFVMAACAGDTPTAPREATQTARPGTGFVTAQNAVPNLNLKTTPRADRTGELATITGKAPLTVKFNLCTSDDADQVLDPNGRELPNGDSLNWQFNFGDPNAYAIGPAGIPSPDPAFNPVTGAFRPDFDHFCRTEHTYEQEGRYVATVSVTDKHLEDEGAGTLARRTERVLIVALGEPTGQCDAAPTVGEFPSDAYSDGPPYSFATAGFFTGSNLTFSMESGACDASREVAAAGEVDFATIDPTTGVITFEGHHCVRVTAANACGSATSEFFVLHDHTEDD